jgi:enoyl-CoA hydratase/carnithine racemase
VAEGEKPALGVAADVSRLLGACLRFAPFQCGPARVFTARLIEAEEGQRIGLYSEVLADQAALMSRARELASTIAGHAPLTMRATKEALRRLVNASVPAEGGEDLVVMCYTSADFREGMEAFLGKRSPQWQGR